MGAHLEEWISKYEGLFSRLDCQDWEEGLPRGLENLQTTKKARLKTGLIDVDLVRGSTFTKSKGRQSLFSLLLTTALAVIFFPIRKKLWHNRYGYLVGCLVYFSCLVDLILYHLHLYNFSEQIGSLQLYEPVVLFAVLVLLRCHLNSPKKPSLSELYLSRKPSRSEAALFRTKRSLSTSSSRSSEHLKRRSGSEVGRSSCLLDLWNERIGDFNEPRFQDSSLTGHSELDSSGGTLSSEPDSDQESLVSEPPLMNGRTRRLPSFQRSSSPLRTCYSAPSMTASCCHVVNKIGCTVWKEGEPAKIRLSALEIGSSIFERSHSVPESVVYAATGLVFAVVLSIIPLLFNLHHVLGLCEDIFCLASHFHWSSLTSLSWMSRSNFSTAVLLETVATDTNIFRFILISTAVKKLVLLSALFFLLAVTERAFKRRFLTAKLFSHITSTRRSMRSRIPHFRLYKVRNIKAWLCVRSLLRRRGPQHSIDSIVSAAFVITLVNVLYLCYELLKEDSTPDLNIRNCEVICWCLSLGFYLLRYMSLSCRTEQKYRNLSVLLTEQINLYLRMEEKPEKKEQLSLANNVLKLSSDLLKELETPFRIRGLSANPFLYNLTKLLVLSAVSGALSEMLGFKLKLYKVKIK